MKKKVHVIPAEQPRCPRCGCLLVDAWLLGTKEKHTKDQCIAALKFTLGLQRDILKIWRNRTTTKKKRTK